MKITLEHYGIKITVSTKRDDLHIQETLGLVATALVGAGYGEKLVDEHIPLHCYPGDSIIELNDDELFDAELENL